MKRGVSEEIKPQKYRLGLAAGSSESVAVGHSVFAKANAEAGIGATDYYCKRGAVALRAAREVLAYGDMIVKEPR
ncbi:hypothetical protein FXV83_29690 [Bradyrhizobium hipponense]|uniref:Uncharacterized protein n=1 Tax=Bradyrhizobium hipponense TaxID=2605638 RepID=A0A5S4YF36_9BRAD|nr:hypothetical protein [Bradyrhizobium hipponense]TYO63020.1 hypothetical protein FXV83_29690 [Bradyrhizobium hipponense]